MTDVLASKHSINLLQPELIPVKPLWSLKRVCIVWGIVLIAMVAWAYISQHQLVKAESHLNQLKNEKAHLNSQLSNLENQLETHKPDNNLKGKIDLLSSILTNKTQLYKELTDTTKTQVAGFAKSMTELSENHHKGISLSVTKNPQSVPAWLAGFENSTFLSGKRFINFLMNENEQNEVEFTVSSIADLEGLENE